MLFFQSHCPVFLQHFCICTAQFHCSNCKKVEGSTAELSGARKGTEGNLGFKITYRRLFGTDWLSFSPLLFLFLLLFSAAEIDVTFLVTNRAHCASMVLWKFTEILSIIFDFSVVRLSPIIFTWLCCWYPKRKYFRLIITNESELAGKKCLIEAVLHD